MGATRQGNFAPHHRQQRGNFNFIVFVLSPVVVDGNPFLVFCYKWNGGKWIQKKKIVLFVFLLDANLKKNNEC